MSFFRDEMRKARAVLHRDMGDGAVVFQWPVPQGSTLDLKRIKVRVHEKYLVQGDLEGAGYHAVELEDNAPVAVFWLEEYRPVKGMCFLTEYGRGYIIETVKPEDDQTQNARVKELNERQMAGWPEYPHV